MPPDAARPELAPAGWNLLLILPFGELEALAGLPHSVFFPFHHARIAREEPVLPEDRTEFGMDIHQRPGDTELHRPRLAAHTAAAHADDRVVFAGGFGRHKGQHHLGALRLEREILFDGSIVDPDFSGPGPHRDPG